MKFLKGWAYFNLVLSCYFIYSHFIILFVALILLNAFYIFRTLQEINSGEHQLSNDEILDLPEHVHQKKYQRSSTIKFTGLMLGGLAMFAVIFNLFELTANQSEWLPQSVVHEMMISAIVYTAIFFSLGLFNLVSLWNLSRPAQKQMEGV